jgi:protein TonB
MFERNIPEQKMLDREPDFPSLDTPPPEKSPGRRQHQLMVGSLLLLLIALGMLLYNDRDFWFPETQEAEDTLPGPASTGSVQDAAQAAGTAPHVAKKRSASRAQVQSPSPADPPAVTAIRTVLPPLQVEVVAGNIHNPVHPGTNSVHVELLPGTAAQTSAQPSAQAPSQPINGTPGSEAPDTTAAVTSNAAENVHMSADTSAVVSHTVKPGYPVLARQMQVQGSVTLQALINKDGSIQDLHILSGPPILASAAREAVRQWRFKPHYQGAEAVETLAKITVNFTISTN